MNRLVDMPFTEDIRNASGTEMVRYCSQVTKADILRAINHGAHTLTDI